jgi:MSHA biogenesis protein MshL
VKFTYMTPQSDIMIETPSPGPLYTLPSGTPRTVSGWAVTLAASLLAGCAADRPLRTPDVTEAVRAELAAPLVKPPPAVPATVSDALAEPVPKAMPLPVEPRIDLLVNDAQAREVFLAIVADTRYSMLMHPDVSGKLSVTLRGVTVKEALESIRDVYGYDFKMEGRRITIYAPTLQTRIFTINYPNSPREGRSELRIASSGGTATNSADKDAGQSTDAAKGATGAASSGGNYVNTNSKTDFWNELAGAVRGLIGLEVNPGSAKATGVTPSGAGQGTASAGQGRNVIVSPQAGIMAVRAMPDELREVDKFLKAAQIAIERQVMLEAKIVEVVLSDGYQSGIDWSALKNGGGKTGAVGVLGSNVNSPTTFPGTTATGTPTTGVAAPTTLTPSTTITSTNALVRGVWDNVPGFSSLSTPAAGAGLFGLAFATDGFQAVLGFLETRGDVQILSSPRIATMNNQKAVLKVGSEDSYIISMTPGVAGTATTAGTPATPKFGTFFSGISLDVTPQIDDGNNITLHVHPSVTKVTSKDLTFNSGTGSISSFPTASSNVNESDTVVRIQDGNIVAIGGLMQIESNRQSSGLPGTTDAPLFSSLFGNKANSGRKKEVVVLIKPTIIRNAEDWEAHTRKTQSALDDMDATRARVIRMDGSVYNVEPVRPAR